MGLAAPAPSRLSAGGAENERFIAFARCERSALRSAVRTAKRRLLSAVETEAQSLALRFTHRMRHTAISVKAF